MKRKYRRNQRRGRKTANKRLTLLKSVSKLCKTAAVKMVKSQKGKKRKTLTSNRYSVSVLTCLTPTTCPFHRIN